LFVLSGREWSTPRQGRLDPNQKTGAIWSLTQRGSCHPHGDRKLGAGGALLDGQLPLPGAALVVLRRRVGVVPGRRLAPSEHHLHGVAAVAEVQQLVVGPAVDQAVAHPEVVALGERHPAGRAREAVQVVDGVAGPHHQLVGGDAGLTAAAPRHREHPVDNRTTCH
jgi:hypothetical protein